MVTWLEHVALSLKQTMVEKRGKLVPSQTWMPRKKLRTDSPSLLLLTEKAGF